MKKLIIFTLVMSSVALFAQKDSTKKKEIEIQIDDNIMKIESENLKSLSEANLGKMIMEATQKMAQAQKKAKISMARIDKMEASGEISAEEAAEMREETEERMEDYMDAMADIMETWGEAYGEKMEAWGENYEAQMEAWEEEVERATAAGKPVPPMPPVPPVPGFSSEAPSPTDTTNEDERVVIRKDKIILKKGDKEEEIITWDYEGDEDADNDDEAFDDDFFVEPEKKSKKIERTEGYVDLHFGWNVQLEEGQYLVEDVPGEQDIWKSTSFSLGAGAKSRIGSPYSKFYIKYGGEFSWHNFRLSGNEVLARNGDRAFFTPLDSIFSSGAASGLDKNKYHVAYFNVPIMFQLDFSEPGQMDERWTFGLGGYGGLKINSKRELEYTTANYNEVEEKAYANYYMSSFRYGLMAQVGYEAYKLTMSYDINPFFRSNRGPGAFDYNMINLTIGITI